VVDFEGIRLTYSLISIKDSDQQEVLLHRDIMTEIGPVLGGMTAELRRLGVVGYKP
jgi:hypothetical protein